jgi:folate-binding protein YgfZ
VKRDYETDDVGLLRTGAVLHGGRERELVVATGADRVAFLHRVVTGNVAGTPVGGGCRSALLTLKGHVVADMLIFVRPADIWIVTDAGQGDVLAQTLSKYAVMDDVAFARQKDFGQVGVLGPSAEAAIRSAGVAFDGKPLPGPALLSYVQHSDFCLVKVHELGVDGYWVAGPEDPAVTWNRLQSDDVLQLSGAAAEAARIEALEGRWGAEITPDYFPMEVGLTEAIDYTKGCYLGQEPIVRLRDRGHINWRLVQLDVDGSVDPAPGDALESDVKPKAGKLTSVGRFPGGRAVALGMLHVSVPVGAAVRIKHGDAVIAAHVRQSV